MTPVANTAALAVAFLCVQIPASLGLAMLVNARHVRAKSFFRFAFFSTYLVGPVFVSVLFQQMLNPRQGLVNRVIGALIGYPADQPPQILWLQNEYLARLSILITREASERAAELERTLARSRADSASLLAEQERRVAEDRRRVGEERAEAATRSLTEALANVQLQVDGRFRAWAEERSAPSSG